MTPIDRSLAGRRAAFIDRDGVINRDSGYVFRPADFEFLDGVLPACAALSARGFTLVVVTNQSGIGRGLYSEGDFATLTGWMQERFAQAGAPLAGVYFCPHHPVEAQGNYRRDCDCRKPAPGMLLRAAADLGLDLGRSVLFGDRATDLQAARAAGVPVRVLLGTDGAQLPALPTAVDDPAGDLVSARFARFDAAVAALDAVIQATTRPTARQVSDQSGEPAAGQAAIR